jgi:molybdopterin synthase catalytic subunit
MRVSVRITEGPLGPAAATDAPEGVGAMTLFEGIVRGEEDGRTIAALEYEAYEPMASRMLRRLGESVIEAHGVLGVAVEHSVGRVGVGEVSFRLRVWSAHRAEGLIATGDFIDRMKRDVPIWKSPAWA